MSSPADWPKIKRPLLFPWSWVGGVTVNPRQGNLAAPLPRLLYLGDVPVESTVYGAALLYRLLESYPPDDLVVLEANPWRSKPQHRLPAVRYGTFPLGNARLLNSRFQKLYSLFLVATARRKWRYLPPLLTPFVPEAVLTVTHGLSWIAAAEYACQKAIPLHLILHDDWPSPGLLPGPIAKHAGRVFLDYYRRATSRLCISPVMAEVYQNECFEPAAVLYPCAGTNAPILRDPPERLWRNPSQPVLAYGGTVSNPGQAQVLGQVAAVLAGFGGRLLIYGPLTHEQAHAWHLDQPNVELKGFIPSSAMVQAFRENADALLIPVSFRPQDRRQALMSFPSKLADYTRAALPLLIVAPQYSSLVKWAGDAVFIEEMVTTESIAPL